MKKSIRRRTGKFLLFAFSINLLIVPDAKPMAAPLAIPTIEALITLGAAVGGLVATMTSHLSPDKLGQFLGRERVAHTVSQRPPVIISPTTTVAASVVQKATPKAMAAPVHQVTTSVAQAIVPHVTTTAPENVTSTACSNTVIAQEAGSHIAQQEFNRIQSEAVTNTRTEGYVLPYTTAESSFVSCPIDNGVRFETRDGRAYASMQYTNQSYERARLAYGLELRSQQLDFQNKLQRDPQFKDALKENLRGVVGCMLKTQSQNLAERVKACIVVQHLQTYPLLSGHLQQAVSALHDIYYHRDGSVCATAVNRQIKAGDVITEFVDSVVEYSGHLIKRDDLINPADYQRIKPTTSQKVTCSHQDMPLHEAQEFNRDVLACVDACQHADFKKADLLLARHSNENTIFRKIIEHQHAEIIEAHNSLYDSQGILNAVHNDPAYIAHKNEFGNLTAAEKKAVNENLLVRNHLKNDLLEKMHLSGPVQPCVLDAVYTLIGIDGKNLGQLADFKACVEKIVQDAPLQDRDTLIHAFYGNNGVLKEFTYHLTGTQKITFSKDMCSSAFDVARNQLNDLVYTKITCPDKAELVDYAITQLKDCVAATGTADSNMHQKQFVQAYEAAMQQNETESPGREVPSDSTLGAPTEEDGFVPRKNSDNQKHPHPKTGQRGWVDKKGNWWIPDKSNHGGPHWDVVSENGRQHQNVYPGGKIRS